LQEVITLVVFMVFSYVAFQSQIKPNHIIGFVLLVLAVYFIFK
ncbi:MAG: DMT family protein, partial [Bacteroidales bacterium]|nr:DMT family protein [Bacteroidales bacterium]